MPDETTGGTRCRRAIAEVHELHRFFVDWLGDGAGDIARLAGVLAPGFRMVSPSGGLAGREQVIGMLDGARGGRGAGFRISVEEAKAVEIATGLCLVTYVERQEGRDRPTARRSSALFRDALGTPQGVQWLHLHETWIEPPRPIR